MKLDLKHLLVGFLLTNAIFWGMFSHTSHCYVVSEISKLLTISIQCPEHKVHLMMGFIFFALTVYVSQKDSKYL
jgi:hypothetical protein